MLIYLYGSYITDDKERLEERISEDIAKHVHSIASVEVLAESAYENIDEEQCSCKGLFDYMRKGYVFLDYCAKEAHNE